MITNWIGVYIVVSITPPGNFSLHQKYHSKLTLTPTAIANIGWKYYIIFAVLNLSWTPFIWYFYVETAGLSLEEVDLVFSIKHKGDKNMTYEEARILAREQSQNTRVLATEKGLSVQQEEIVEKV
jgi:hypothetical protein